MRVNYKVHKLHQRYILIPRGCTSGGVYVEDVLLVEFMYLVLTRMPGESYRRRLGGCSSGGVYVEDVPLVEFM